MKNTTLISVLLLACYLSLPMKAVAQTVTSVKGTRALLDLGGESWGPGDRVFAVDSQGKKRSLLQIRQVKNGKAVSDVVKGVPATGMSLMMGKKAGSTSASSSSTLTRKGLRSGAAYGYSIALMMNTMKISNYVWNSTSHSFDMVGTNFGAGMFYDYPLTSSWFARGNGTLEMFDVTKKYSSSVCKSGTTANCSASFMQAGFYGTFNYVFTPSPYRFWAGGGGGAVIYLNKESTVLNTSKFFFNTVIMGAAGIDIFSGRNTFFPITFEYQMIPDKEAGVTSMVIRGGWGKTF